MMRARKWAGAALTALLAGSCFAALTPPLGDDARDSLPWLARDPAVMAAQRAWSDAQARQLGLEREWRRAYAHAVAAPLASARAPFSFSAARGIPLATVSEFERRARAEFAAIGAARHPIVVRMVEDSLAQQPGYHRAIVAPAIADQACVVAVIVSAPRDARIGVNRNDEILGPCAFYAAFGMPGAGMQQWLERTGARSAASATVRPVPPSGRTREEVPQNALLHSPAAVACLAGRTDYCGRAFNGEPQPGWGASGRMALPPPPALRVTDRRAWTFSPWEAHWSDGERLAAIRQMLGDLRFAPLWQSPDEPAVAFERLEGYTLDAWVRRQLLTEVLPYRAGPMVPTTPLVLALLLIGALAAWALRRTERALT